MTIYRENTLSLQAQKAQIVELIRKILRDDPAYHGTIEGVNNSFLTNIHPQIFIMNTPMTVTVEETNSMTIVKASIKSQSFIKGDAFNFYNKYIDEFLEKLKHEVSRASTSRQTP